jgi:hypothetical protein
MHKQKEASTMENGSNDYIDPIRERKAQKNRRPNGRVTAGTTSGLCIGLRCPQMEARTPLTLEVWADTHAVANPALGAMSSSPVAIVTPALSQPPRALSDSTNMDPAQRAALRIAQPSHAHGPCTAVAAPGAPRQPQQLDGSTEHEPRPPTAENPNRIIGLAF